MAKCFNCGKKSSFFHNTVNFECDLEDCDKVFCEDCAKKSFKKCPKCGGQFCAQSHLDDHVCGEDEEEETSEDGGDIIEYSPDKKLVVIDTNNTGSSGEDMIHMSRLLSEGYSFFFSHENFIYFRRD